MSDVAGVEGIDVDDAIGTVLSVDAAGVIEDAEDSAELSRL